VIKSNSSENKSNLDSNYQSNKLYISQLYLDQFFFTKKTKRKKK